MPADGPGRQGDVLLLGRRPLFSGAGDELKWERPIESDEDSSGEVASGFVRFEPMKQAARRVVRLGRLFGLSRFTACHRYEPFWMKPAAGHAESELPDETQSFLGELSTGEAVLLIPLVDEPARACLRGGPEGLELCLETADPWVTVGGSRVLFVGVGPDPYRLLELGAARIVERLGQGRLRREKPLPAFVDHFGWCTWDAFYTEVSEEKVRQGLQSFSRGGVRPRFLILDDGWQSVNVADTGERRLAGLKANQKFSSDLSGVTRMAREEHGVETFLVWHALLGYWGGVEPEAFSRYRAAERLRWFGPGILHHFPVANTDHWGSRVGLIAEPEAVTRFYDDYHRGLAEQGVTGIKVDSQAVIEGVSHGLGGRVRLNRIYSRALEGSALRHFGGNLIHCMSNAQETYFFMRDTNLIRTSTDFWPRRPETHGEHLHSNAQVGAFFGELAHPDWDMFQSGHPAGAFHAAGRAVSGGPVYVSDRPGEQDFELLQKLVLSDGRILRARGVGKPTRDCLYRDPTRESVLLKIFNHNPAGGVLGAFNARYTGEAGEPIRGEVGPADIAGLQGQDFAVHSHRSERLFRASREERFPIELSELSFEIFTVAPLLDGFAPVGFPGFLNGGAAVLGVLATGPDAFRVELCHGGELIAFSDRAALGVTQDGRPAPFREDRTAQAIWITVAGTGPQAIEILLLPRSG